MCSYNVTLSNFSILVECAFLDTVRGEGKVTQGLFKTEMTYSNLIVSTVLCSIVCLLGVVTNVINMAVFTKIGFKDSINMSLFALAISDLGSCLFLVPCIVGGYPWIDDLGLPVNWIHVGHITGAWPHVACTKITTLITAFITAERCLCVFVPLKVKTIITRRRALAFLISSFLFVGGLMAPIFYSNQLGWRAAPGFGGFTNRSVLGLVFPKEREDIERVVLPVINAFISIFAFVFIIVATIVLVVTLKKQSKWRLTAATKMTNSTTTTTTTTTTGKNDKKVISSKIDSKTSTKEHAISRMVVFISILFIGSLFPYVVLLLLLWTDRRFDIGGSLNNLFIIMVNVTYTVEGLNAALNIIIYYKNSTNYKTMFDQIFGLKEDKVKSQP